MNDAELVEVLLSGGANPNLASPERKLPLFIAIENCLSTQGTKNKSSRRIKEATRIAEKLFANGANPNCKSPTPLSTLVNYLSASVQRRTNVPEAQKMAIIELIVLCVSHGAAFDEHEFTAITNFGGNNITLDNFIIPPNSRHDTIMTLLKAGAGLTMLSICCAAESQGQPTPDMSIRLCQAIVLAGYPVEEHDLEKFTNTFGITGLQLKSWLKEHLSCPSSLICQSRIAVRRQLLQASRCRTIIPLIERLQIPRPLQSYLKFEGQHVEADLTAYPAGV